MPSLNFFGDLKSLTLLFLVLTFRVASTSYDEYWATVQQHDANVGWSENLDPARANPVRNVTCIGNSLDLKLPMLGNFNPNQVSMQKLCAKPQYNGGAPGQHVGAYCHEPPFAPYTGDIAFDVSPDARVSPILQKPRVLLSCRYRCFCNWGLADTSVQPKTTLRLAQFAVHRKASYTTYELQLDVNDDFTTPFALKIGRQGNAQVDSLKLITQSQLAREGRWPSQNEPYEWVSLDPGNKIRCYGDMPSFPLPPPYTHQDFTTLSINPVQKLCATQLSGGAKGANAGGYCHRSDTPDGPKSEVWFSDDMTPRLDWTWAGGNFFASASIRFFCWQHCTCSNNANTDRLREDSARRLWAFTFRHQLTQLSSGSVYLQTSDTTGLRSNVQVLPPQRGAGPSSGSCGANGTDFCPRAWDQVINEPVPSAPPNVTDIVKPPNGANSTVCGNTCQGLSDCGSTDSQYSCSCAYPSTDDSRKLGLDPVAPVAVCLALFMTSVQSKLGGRDVPEFVDARGVPQTCQCNETYTGTECCGSTNMMLPTTL